MKVSRIIGYTIIVGLTLIAVGLMATVSSPAVAQALGMNFNCRQTFLDAGGFVLECRPLEVVTPTATNTPVPFTPTENPTAVPTGTPDPTSTPQPTDTPEPTGTPFPTGTPVPGAHDTAHCHSEVIDGHSHGMCLDQIPDGPIRDWLLLHPEWLEVGYGANSSPSENLHPFPAAGKHVGFKAFYQEFANCHRFVNSTGAQSPGSCVMAIYHLPHSVGIAEAMYTPGGRHSDRMLALVCESATDPDCGVDNVVAVAQVPFYGEVHTSYKRDFCEGLEGAIEYPNPGHHLNQPPYVAVRSSARDKILWSSLTNSLMQSQVGPVNLMLQTAWTETVWESPSPNPQECGIPAFDVPLYDSTDDGFRLLYWLFTVKISIGDLPRPFAGYTDRNGAIDASCTDVTPDCLPVLVGSNVPAGDVFFNRAVLENQTEPLEVDITGAQRP